MKKIILFGVFAFFAVNEALGGCRISYGSNPNQSLNVNIADYRRNEFVVGETVVIPLKTEGCQCVWGDDKETYCNCELSYSLKKGSISLTPNHKTFLSQSEIDDYYGVGATSDVYNCHWRNQESFWMELSGLARDPGKYEGVLTVQKYNDGTLESKKDVPFSFEVKEASNQEKVAILSKDVAANFSMQMELYSKLQFNGNLDRPLHKPYYDYYLSKISQHVLFDIWDKPKNMCLQILDCGSGNYVLRHRYKEDIGVRNDGYFQLALFENQVLSIDNSYAYSEKSSKTGLYVDYSYKYPGAEISYHADMRNAFYNDRMALFEGDENKLYGSTPSWYGSHCVVMDPANFYRDDANPIIYNGAENSELVKKNLCKASDFEKENPITIEFDKDHDVIYEGEDYFALPTVTSTEGEIKSLEITYQDQFDWLESGTPDDYWANNYKNSGHSYTTSWFTKTFYIRSINRAVRQNHNLPVGSYTYTIKATDDKNNEAVATRTVEILDGSRFQPSSNNGSGLAVLTGDETWFTTNQLDIASGIERFADAGMYHLNKGYHYDYFGQVDGSVQGFKSVFNNWYSNDGVSQTLYDCGEGRYKIKYEITCDSRWSVNFDQSILDVKTGVVYGSGADMHKENDYSMAPFVHNGKLELYARKYNPNVPLYDDKGNLLWGNPPEWHEQCTDFVKILPYETDEPRCDDGGDNGGGNGGDNGGEVITNSNLKVQFFDAQATNDYYGDFQFKVANVGTADAQIGGYELRFYYSDNKKLENASLAFAPNYVDNGSLSFEQCADNKYIMRLKLNSGASVKAGGKYPENDPLKAGVSSKNGQINKKSMDSWNNASVLTDNPKMSLYDASGRLVYGEPTPSCGQSVHDSEDDEKKKQEYKYRYLTIQFQDTDKNKKTQNGDFKFQIKNSGEDDFPIGNYEMRFFFESKKGKFDASDIGFIPGNLANSQVTKEWCGDGRYFMKIKMASDAVVKADNHFPEYYPVTVSVRRLSKENEGIYLDYYKNDLFSWNSYIEMTDNKKMGLFDATGNLVWGYPGYKCENPVTVTPGSKIDKSRFLVEETEKLLPFKFYDEDKGKNVTLENGINEVSLKVKNVSELDEAGPVYVDYYITHPVGQNPLFCYSRGTTCFASSSSSSNVEFSVPDVVFDLRSDLSVKRMSTGNKHVYRFTLKNGLKKKSEVEFKFSLRDECADCLIEEPKPGPYITIPNPGMILCEFVDKEGLEPIEGCDREWDPTKYFIWKIEDDWSAESGLTSEYTKTERVVIYSKNEVVLYGHGDDGDAKFKNSNGYIPIPGITVQEQFPNRTDAVAYSGGQLLLNGDFEDPSLIGWDLDDGVASSIRGTTVQGSRFLRLNGSVSQKLPSSTMSLLLDSGAVLSFWHRSELCDENASSNKIIVSTPYPSNGSSGPRPNTYTFDCSKEWKKESIVLRKSSIMVDENTDLFTLTLKTHKTIDFDDVVLIPSAFDQPSTYAVRLTTTQHEELETRAYDNDRDSVIVTSSKRDAMGRNRYKYLPFKMMCADAENCNADPVTLSYPDMAQEYYKGHPDYADAKGFPYVETLWKPDPAATKDVVGAAGKAFSLDEGTDVHHVTRSYSSGINLTGIDKMDFNSLASAVNAVRNCRVFEEKDCRSDGKSDDGVYNFHAAKDVNPTHTWELIIDPNGNAAFTVKDGEGHTIISGAMKKPDPSENSQYAYKLVNRSVNELDARGNVLKAHSPLSCEYKNASQANCVRPNTYDYDSESRVIKSWEPDAGTTLTYYDFAGRIRATQSQKQIENKTASVLVYDHLDRVVATGEWNHGYDESNLGTLRTNLLSDESDVNNGFTFPKENDLTPGTITRTFYDKVPSRTLLGVELYPDGVNLHNTRGRVAAVVSDVKDDGNGNVVRVSSANSYDKYGRVVTNYSYDPTMPEDSLKMLAVATQYDLSGKVVATTKFPYGITIGGQGRSVNENYIYDRLGRLYIINSKNGIASSAEIARYDYYPTGAVKSITMGKSIILSYTYHISGAVKTAEVKAANGMKLYSEKLYYEDFEDCGSTDCKPQFNGNISRMFHQMAHTNSAYGKERDVAYIYDELNRLTRVKDSKQPMFDEMFEYDAQGRITAQHRAQQQNGAFALAQNPTGGEYTYEGGSNKLKSVADGMGGATADARHMGDNDNFVYDSEGNLTFDKSKQLQISYDWRGMPVEFTQIAKPVGSSDNKLYKLVVNYDGSGRRISKTSMYKDVGASDWQTSQVTHYTGIGTEIRENFAGPAPETKVVVNLPQGLGRYEVENAAAPDMGGLSGEQLAGYIPNAKFEWYVKNHLGSTMLVFGTEGNATSTSFPVNAPLAAYDYRAFGEQVNLVNSYNGVDKVTENFTGKELDDEIALNYFGARYLDPMLGLWISVDTKRQFSSPYLYAGNGMNPVNGVDPNGNDLLIVVSRDKSGGTGRVNMYTSREVKAGKTQVSENYPLYNFYISNESGNFAIVKGTRDVLTPGYKSFASKQLLRGRVRIDGDMGFRVEALDPDTNTPTVVDETGKKRTNIQLHKRGASHGCGMMDKANYEKFKDAVEMMKAEDLSNGYEDGIDMQFESFEPAGN